MDTQAIKNEKSIDLRSWRTIVLMALVFCSVFIYHHNFFYRHGGYLLDAALWVSILYKNSIIPLWPAWYHFGGFGSVLYQYHLCPVVSLVSLASYLSPVGRLDWFNFCQAVCYALIAYSMCSLVDMFLGGKKNLPWVIAGGTLGLIYTLNGFLLSCLAYPHPEIAIVAFGLCFLVSLLRGRRVIAGISFLLACSVREDAGFHLTAILSALWIASFLEPHLAAWRRRFLLFACLAFGASIAMIVAQRLFFPPPPATSSPLQSAFFGGEVTWRLTLEHIAGLHKTALSLILAVAASAVCAVVTRKYVLLLCWVVYIPWFLLNIVSPDPSRHALGIYHVFPFIFAVAWPLMALPPLALDLTRPRLAKMLAVVFVLGIAPAAGQRIAMPGMFNALMADLVDFRYQNPEPFDALAGSLQSEPQLYGQLGLDDCAGCLFLDFMQERNIVHEDQKYDTLVFFKNTMFTQKMIRLVMNDGLDHCQSLEGTNALVVSNREIPGLIDGKPVLKPSSLWLSLEQFAPRYARRQPDGSIAQSKADVSMLAHGPYVPLPAGKYRVTFQIDGVEASDRQAGASKSAGQPVAKLIVCYRNGTKIAATADVNGADLPATVAVPFEVSPDQANEDFEFCVVSLGRERLCVKEITLDHP